MREGVEQSGVAARFRPGQNLTLTIKQLISVLSLPTIANIVVSTTNRCILLSGTLAKCTIRYFYIVIYTMLCSSKEFTTSRRCSHRLAVA